MINMIIILSILLIFCNNITTETNIILRWNFKTDKYFELDDEHTTYILRSIDSSIKGNILDFVVNSTETISEIRYLFSNRLYDNVDTVLKNFQKATPTSSTQGNNTIYKFRAQYSTVTDYFYLAIYMNSIPEEANKRVYVSFTYGSDSSPEPAPTESNSISVVTIIIIVVIGICACCVGGIVCLAKGGGAGCDAACSCCEDCLKCVDGCCACLAICSK